MAKRDDFGVKTTGDHAKQFVTEAQNNPDLFWKRRNEKPRVLFVYHNDVEDGFVHPALAALSGALKAEGIEHKLFDTSFMRDESSPHKESVRELRERVGEEAPTDFKPVRRNVKLEDEFRKTVHEYNPDLIALSSTSYDFHRAADFIRPIREETGIPVIVGGAHALVVPEKAIKNPAIDIVCIGEGEKPLVDLVKGIGAEESVSNIRSLFLKDPKTKEVYKNPKRPGIKSLDENPESDWDMFDPRHVERPFMGKTLRQGFVEISRGCPFKCSYCIQPILHATPSEGGVSDKHNYIYYKDPELLIDRIAKLKERHGFTHMQLIDENLPTMPKEVLDSIRVPWNKRLNPKGDLSFFTMSRPEYLIRKDGTFHEDGSPRRVSNGKSETLSDMGCVMVAMGAESGSEWLRKHILNRPMQTGILEAGADALMNAGIEVSLYNIIGFPFETREMIMETAEQAWRIKPHRYSVRFMTPYPGTPIRGLAIKHKMIHPDYEALTPQGAKSFLHEPVLERPEYFDFGEMEMMVAQDGEEGGFERRTVEHPQGPVIRHPQYEELMGLRKLFGIYAFSPTKSMWPIIGLAENRGFSSRDSLYRNGEIS